MTALVTAGWFIASAVLLARFRHAMRWGSNIPLDIWSYVWAVVFAALGVAALRRNPRAPAALLGCGLATVLLSAMSYFSRWDLLKVLLGAVMAASGWRWSRTAPPA